jgi:hypothetical protein
MTRIAIYSDLHLEFGELPRPGTEADVVVLAGDIYTKGRVWPSRMGDARDFFGCPHVVLVPGNHEFYDMKVDTAVAKMREVAAAKGITVLDNDEYVVDGLRILGATLWSDFKLWAGDDFEGIKRDANFCVGSKFIGGITDFWSIRVAMDGYRRFRPKDAAMLHYASVAWLDKKLAEPFTGETVVATHHAPSLRCVPELWLNDRRTCAYASHLDWLIEKHSPALWGYGHIHEACPPFSIGRTRLVSNPRGYVPDHLNPSFDAGLVVEVGAPTPVPGACR